MCCGGAHRTLRFSEAPHFTVTNPYILGSYRPKQDFKEALASLFALHNETLNIWTHLLSGIVCVACLATVWVASEEKNFLDDIIVSFAFLSCLACYLFSAAYHLFKNLSEHMYDRMLSVDYTGIILATVGLQCSCCYFSFFCDPIMRLVYPIISVSLATPTLILVLQPKLSILDSFYALCSPNFRVALFAIFLSWGIVPICHFWRTVVPVMDEVTPAATIILVQMLLAYGFFLGGVLVWLFHFPERLWVGKFDIWLNSHQWWHIAVIMGTGSFLAACLGARRMKDLYGCQLQ